MSWLKRDSHLWGAPPAEMFTLTVRFVLKHVCVTSSPREEARTKKNIWPAFVTRLLIPGLHNTPGSARVVGVILFVLFCVF